MIKTSCFRYSDDGVMMEFEFYSFIDTSKFEKILRAYFEENSDGKVTVVYTNYGHTGNAYKLNDKIITMDFFFTVCSWISSCSRNTLYDTVCLISVFTVCIKAFYSK